MAKQTVKDIFSRTDKAKPSSQDNSDLDQGNIKPMGVGLREGEIAALDVIGAEYEISRNALLRLAARRFILAYRAGEIDLRELIVEPPPPKKKLTMPK